MYELIIQSILIIGAVVFLLWYFNNKEKQRQLKSGEDKSMLLLQNQLQDLQRVMDSKLSESTRMMQGQFGETAKIVRQVTEKLTKLDDTNKQVVNFAGQLESLQNILKNPKQRGVLGEYYLETVLKNVMPPKTYQMQYSFKDGAIVDAVVFVKDKIIPIDSKFSLENYNRILETNDQAEKDRLQKQFKQDLKNRIDETAKYIRPQEGTMDFAFMFIPAEAIYYDLLVNQVGAIKVNTRDLIEYAMQDKHVLIVSPTSFLAYLQTVLQGLRALQIEESAKDIRTRVEMLGKHLLAYDDYFKKIGNHLLTTVNAYNYAQKELGKVDKDVLKITDGQQGGQIEVVEIQGPRQEE